MPLIRIDVPATLPTESWRQAVEVVYEALLSEFRVPEHDLFAVVTSHEPLGLQIDRSYLGVARSENAVIIQITLNAGRDVALKRAFYAAVADGLEDRVGIKKSDVMISLVEVPPENWSFGDGIAQYAPE
ncbi:tautomerase family protein [Streptomyces sp. NPDC059396]|uniref:tautomerase family protein n=1 Tax=Streptomyces sp. NPDC059396 TaxID=3346819 RepID=UPI00368FAF45